MTFLELCQRVRQEAGISGTGPSSVVSQSGENKRIVDWVNSAWEDIQLARPDWFWMRSDFSFQTVVDQYAYTPVQAGIASRFSNWDTDSISTYLTSTGVADESGLNYIDYASYRDQFLTGVQTASRPIACSISPVLSLLIGYRPNAVYTVHGEYFKAPQTLSAGTDTPEMPSQFHMAIVYRALMLYARYEAAAEIYSDAELNYRRLIKRIELSQLPDISTAVALVQHGYRSIS